MLGYTRGISCIASSRRRTMSAAAGRVADPKKKSSATMRHERCQTAKPSTRGRVPATSAAFPTASDSERWQESQRRRGSSPSRRRLRAPTALDGGTVDAWLRQRHQLPHRQQQAAHHECSRRKSRRPEEGELGDDEARAVPDGKAVDAGQNACHVCCVPHSERLGTMARVAASSRVEPITTTTKSAHGA
jgi:hypothetical protein